MGIDSWVSIQGRLVVSTSTPTLSLEYVKTIGIVNNASNGRGFANPYDTAISKSGTIFVLNRCDPARAAAVRVGVCTLEEEYLGEFGKGYGSGDGQLVWPVAMDFDSRENLYITDEHNHRVTVFAASWEYQATWGVSGSAKGEFNGPAGIAIDRGDHVYIIDQHNHRVQKFTAQGDYVLDWGEAGASEGQFNLPWGIAVDVRGDVYVADWRNDRVQKFSTQGKFLAAFGASGSGEGQFHRPSGVAVDAEGYIYVADWGNERVQVLGPDGRFRLQLRGQATLSRWAEEYFASNPEERRERERSNLTPSLPPHLNTPYHVSSQTEPYFWGPVSVTVDAAGRLYVTETNRHRIQVYQKVYSG
jgi:DNA-binding beta-propeller fold protein YncE